MESDQTCEALPHDVPEIQNDAKKSKPFFSTKFLLTLSSGLVVFFPIAVFPLLFILIFSHDADRVPQPYATVRAALTLVVFTGMISPFFTTPVTAYCLARRQLSKLARFFTILLLVLASCELLFLVYRRYFHLLLTLFRLIFCFA